MASGAQSPRIPSGVPGFDELVNGGFVSGGVYLLLGQPGTGKTIFANQLCFHHATIHDRNIVYVTLLAESHGRLMDNLRSLKYFNDEKVSKSIHYMGGYHALEKDGLKGFLRLIAGIVKEKNASILMIDGLSTIGELEHSAITFRKFAHELNSYLSASGCTAFLLSSMESHLSKPEHTMVDGIISFHYENRGARATRQMEVRKFRGSGHRYGKHTYHINDSGIEVYPRLESAPCPSSLPRRHYSRISWGIRELDKMMNGGPYQGSMISLLGSAGTGKTSLALQFLASGAKKKEKGIYFGFYESPEELQLKADSLAIDIDSGIKKKLITVEWRAPLELALDELAHSILKAVKESGAKRVVVDGLDAFKYATSDNERLYRFIPALMLELKKMDATILMIEEMATFGNADNRQIAELSAVNETVLYLHHESEADEIVRAITVLKMRNSAFERTTREFILSEDGLSIGKKLSGPSCLPPDLRGKGTR